MKAQLFVYILLLTCCVQGAPLVQKIVNNSQIGYLILKHSDTSSCSLQGSSKVIDALSTFQHDFLIDGNDPCLVLRPYYYYDEKTEQKYMLLNDDYEYDIDNVAIAYKAWQVDHKKKLSGPYDWLERWVGGDIMLRANIVEVRGYVIHQSCIEVRNKIHHESSWLNFSRSCFSRLVVDKQIDQHKKKGIKATMKVGVGEGGICKNGTVERVY